MIVVKTLKNPLCFRMSLCTWLLSRNCLSAVEINCHQLFHFVPNKTIRYQLKYFHRNLDFKHLYKKQGPQKKFSNTSNTARYRNLKSIIHCMFYEFASETFFFSLLLPFFFIVWSITNSSTYVSFFPPFSSNICLHLPSPTVSCIHWLCLLIWL